MQFCIYIKYHGIIATIATDSYNTYTEIISDATVIKSTYKKCLIIWISKSFLLLGAQGMWDCFIFSINAQMNKLTWCLEYNSAQTVIVIHI